MQDGHRFSSRFDRRVRELGHEIFERAAAATPRVWQREWWLERMTQLVDADERLKAGAFQFVDCLPSLTDDDDIVRHLAQYMEVHDVELPPIGRWALARRPSGSAVAGLIGRAARMGAGQMAGRFITGHDFDSAVRTIEGFRRRKMAFTLDVLGEATTSNTAADRYLSIYFDLIEHLCPRSRGWATVPMIDRTDRGPQPRVNISIKLTGLDPHFDPIDPARSIRTVCGRIRPLLLRARELGAFVNVDMESFKHRDLTLDLFESLLMEDEFRDWEDVGIAVQAYLTDGERDLARLLEWGRKRGRRFAIRLVKGAYWDAEVAAAVRAGSTPPVWTQKWQSDACYERMTRAMLQNTDLARPCFASHNVRSLAHVLATAEELGLPCSAFELQTLFGMGDPLKSAMTQMGQCVRVYSPYGDTIPGMAYLIRRLLENTSNDSFLKQGFSDRAGHHRLLADPAVARPPSEPLPQVHYLDVDPEQPMSEFRHAPNTNFGLEKNRSDMVAAIQYVRGELGQEYPLVIDGKPVPTASSIDSTNPARPEEVIGSVAQASVADAEIAVATARKAFADWRDTEVSTRCHLIRSVAERLEARRFELAAGLILEAGKPWREADAEISEAVDLCRFYADRMEMLETHPRIRHVPGEDNVVVYGPQGVCAAVGPWNFPLSVLTGITASALAAGNTVVMKPHNRTPVIAAKLMRIFLDAGLPPGVVSLLPGPDPLVAKYLAAHLDVNIVAYTGHRETGLEVLHEGARLRHGQGHFKQLIAELGGKNAIIVDHDADLDAAIAGVVESALSYSGQKCSAASRIIVMDAVSEAFCERLAEAVNSVVIGPPEQPSTLVGPVIDEQARLAILEHIEIGSTEARPLVKRDVSGLCGVGHYVGPVVFRDVPPESKLGQEEIFGPVVAVMRAGDFDEALRIANNTCYALTGGLYSRSPAHIRRAYREFAVGNLYINRKITGAMVDLHPFGGFKLSGVGEKLGGLEYLMQFLNTRTISEYTLRHGYAPSNEEQAVSAS